jgi:PPOX class probable F420-dependent enzyme
MIIDSEVDAFLGETQVVVLATINKKGLPHLTPIWFTWEDDLAYMFTSRTSAKWRNIQCDPNVSLCADRREPPYAAVVLYGLATEVDRSVYGLVLPMAVRYYGEEEGLEFAATYKGDSSGTVVFRLTPDRVVDLL